MLTSNAYVPGVADPPSSLQRDSRALKPYSLLYAAMHRAVLLLRDSHPGDASTSFIAAHGWTATDLL